MAAVVPAWAQMKANFVHSAERMSPLSSAPNPAARHAWASRR
jgi:hypothetical protein